MIFTFKLTVEHTNIIMEALGNTAWKISAPVITELQQQAQAQMQPPPAPVAQAPEAPVQ